METPSKEQLLEDLRLSEEEIKAQPNVFFDGLRKILLGYAILSEAITIHGFSSEVAAKVLAKELDITEAEASKFVEMFNGIDWSEPKKQEKPRQRGGAAKDTEEEDSMFLKMIRKIPGFEEFVEIWKEAKIMPPQRYIGPSQKLIHWEDNTDHLVGAGFGAINFLDRLNDALSRRVGIWAIDRFRPFVSPTKPIPTQLAFSAIILLIELIRMLLTLLPDFLFNWISPFFSTIMAILEIARGDWKHAILTLYGSVKSGFWSSMRWKMVLNTLTLINPETKAQVLEIALNTPRDIMRAFIWWLVTFVMPKQEEIAKVRDIMYVVTGTEVSGIGHLEVQDFYKIRNLLSDSPIWCFTPLQLALKKITKGDPWYMYLLPEDVIKKFPISITNWPARKAASILIAATITIPVIAEPRTIELKCGKSTILKMYEALQRLLDSKDTIKKSLPDKFHATWDNIIHTLEYVDAPDKLLEDTHLSMQEAFGPILQLKEPSGIRQYFQPAFVKQIEEFIKNEDKVGFKEWIHKYPKDQIFNTNASVNLLDPIVMPEAGRFASQISPALQKISNQTLKGSVPQVDALIASLSHMDNPDTILTRHGVTPNDIIKPIVNEPKIAAVLDPAFLDKLKKTAAASASNKVRFVEFLVGFPKAQMFNLKEPQKFLELQSLAQKPPQLDPKVQAALKNFSVPAPPAAVRARLPSPLLSQRLQQRRTRRRQPRSRRSALNRVKTRKTRR